jgi:hypothetical protein
VAPVAKQLTVRGLDARLERTLRAEARRRGLSVNRTVLGLLSEATGLTGDARGAAEPPGRWTDLDHLAGTWSAEEADAFDRQLGATRVLDTELWR